MHSTRPLFNDFSSTFTEQSRLMGSLTPPPELNGDTNRNRRWKAAIIAMAACDTHRDGGFLASNRGLHPLTVAHYSSGIYAEKSKAARIAHSKARKEHLNDIRNLIYDLATILDRLSGGSTIVLHHPGATPPYADIVPEDLPINTYLNPRTLAQHPELHLVGARLVQSFAEEWALPVARAFRDHRARQNWKQESATAVRRQTDFMALPLIPRPNHASSCGFVIPGRPPSQLAQTLASRDTVSYIPRANGGPFEWVCLPIHTILPPTATSQPSPAEPMQPPAAILPGETGNEAGLAMERGCGLQWYGAIFHRFRRSHSRPGLTGIHPNSVSP